MVLYGIGMHKTTTKKTIQSDILKDTVNESEWNFQRKWFTRTQEKKNRRMRNREQIENT